MIKQDGSNMIEKFPDCFQTKFFYDYHHERKKFDPKPEKQELQPFSPDQYELIFEKPIFDMAFIITHVSLMCTIHNNQKYFQSKHKFTTHCILVENQSKVDVCLNDLRKQGIYYAMVVTENSSVMNSYDLYVLHRNKEFLEIPLNDVDFLVLTDFDEMLHNVRIVKQVWMMNCSPNNDEWNDNIRRKNVSLRQKTNEDQNQEREEVNQIHMRENKDWLNINENLRYYLCLLMDCRTLTMSELHSVLEYLLRRKRCLEKICNEKMTNFYEHATLESFHKTAVNYSVYEPSYEPFRLRTPADNTKLNRKLFETCSIEDSANNKERQSCMYERKNINKQEPLQNFTQKTTQFNYSVYEPPPSSLNTGISDTGKSTTISIPGKKNIAIITPFDFLSYAPEKKKTKNIDSSISNNDHIKMTKMNTLKASKSSSKFSIFDAKQRLNESYLSPSQSLLKKENMRQSRFGSSKLSTRQEETRSSANSKRVLRDDEESDNYKRETRDKKVEKKSDDDWWKSNEEKKDYGKGKKNVTDCSWDGGNKSRKVHRPTTVNNNFSFKTEKISKVRVCHAKSFTVTFSTHLKIRATRFKVNRSEVVSTNLFTGLKCRPKNTINQYEDFIDLTSDDNNKESICQITTLAAMASKRKSSDISQNSSDCSSKPSSAKKMSLSSSSCVSSLPKNCSHQLINLFRLILNLTALGLPDKNVVYELFANWHIKILEGIKEPALRNVKIDYQTCKTKGSWEIICDIYTISNEIKREEVLSDISWFMEFLWKKYFPSSVNEHNLLIAFYKLTKLLVLYTVFHKSHETKKIVNNIVENIQSFVWFDFFSSFTTSSTSSWHVKKRLLCFSDIFEKFFQQREQLHNLHSSFSISDDAKPTHGRTPISRKNIDEVIRKRKIEFCLGPLLKYFVNSVNLIGQRMDPVQIETVYGSVRTLRFCLRKIDPILLRSSFRKPISFSFSPNSTIDYSHEISKELKAMISDLKEFWRVLFTDSHYEFLEYLFEFSFKIDETLNNQHQSKFDDGHTSAQDSLVPVDYNKMLNMLCKVDKSVSLNYNSDTEVEHLVFYLKENWTNILQSVFLGIIPEPSGIRIGKEIDHLLPSSWGRVIFDESLNEAAKLYYQHFKDLLIKSSKEWNETFYLTISCGENWLQKYKLPMTNISVIKNYQKLLETSIKQASFN